MGKFGAPRYPGRGAKPPARLAVWTLLLCLGAVLVTACTDCGGRSQYSRVAGKVYERRLESCRAISWRSAPKGVILELRCPSLAFGVIREVKPRIVAPVPFTRVPKSNNTFLILVEYPFRPGRELYVAVITENSRTWSMSPYFPAMPDATDAEYDELASSPQARHYDKSDSLKMLRRIASDLPARDLDPRW